MTRTSQPIHDEPGLARIIETIEAIGTLPTIPPVAQHVMRLARDEHSSMREIAEVISQDQALAAKVLKVVNSAFYALQERVGTLPLALTILGVHEITALVLGVSIMSAFPGSSDNELFNREALWHTSAQRAFAAKKLSHRVGLGRLASEAFLAALVQDIGLSVLDEYCHDAFVEVMQAAKDEGLAPLEAERKYLGTTHASIGAWLAEKWLFPEPLVEAIAFHHRPAHSSWTTPLAGLVYLAGLIVNLYEQEMTAEEAASTIEADTTWARLMSSGPAVQPPASVLALLEELGEEIAAAPLIIG